MIKPFAKWVRNNLPNGVRDQIAGVGRFFALPRPPSLSAGLVFPSIEAALRCLKARGFDPRVAVDVGAYHGEWTLLFKQVFPESTVLMYEAQEEKRKVLEAVCGQFAGSVMFNIALLGATGGQEVRFVEMETGSSVYEEQSRYPRKESVKQTATLDELLPTDSRPVDFLKLDVQGYELEVLRGATRALEQAQFVLMEASLVSTNRGSPPFAEVIKFMYAHDYNLFDFCSQIRRRDGVLWQTDLLFVRSTSKLVPDEQLTAENWV